MKAPETPKDEEARLGALHDLDILDTPLDPTFERITRLTKKMLDVPMVAISLVDKDRQWFKSEQGLNCEETSRDISFCGHAILQDQVFIVPDATKDERFHDNPLVVNEPHVKFYAGYPIRTRGGKKIGSFCIMDTKPRELTEDDIEQLKDMEALVEQQLYAHEQNQYNSKILKELDKAKRDNLIDALTRIWNREGIELNFQEHSNTAKKNNHKLSLAMIDIDNFKLVNDTHGHNAGDAVLKEVTKRILTALDDSNILGRWGGEEFLSIVILEYDTPEACLKVFEKARLNVCYEPIIYNGEKINVSASFGIMVSDNPDANLEDVVAKADDALYRAKEQGKNQCVLAK